MDFYWAACELLCSDINEAKIVLSKLHAARRILLCVSGRGIVHVGNQIMG